MPWIHSGICLIPVCRRHPPHTGDKLFRAADAAGPPLWKISRTFYWPPSAWHLPARVAPLPGILGQTNTPRRASKLEAGIAAVDVVRAAAGRDSAAQILNARQCAEVTTSTCSKVEMPSRARSSPTMRSVRMPSLTAILAISRVLARLMMSLRI